MADEGEGHDGDGVCCLCERRTTDSWGPSGRCCQHQDHPSSLGAQGGGLTQSLRGASQVLTCEFRVKKLGVQVSCSGAWRTV